MKVSLIKPPLSVIFAMFVLAFLSGGMAVGQVAFHQIYGGEALDEATDVIQTADEGYAVVGTTSSFNAQGKDLFLMRVDVFGKILWTKTYGGLGDEEAASLLQTRDGGFVLTGSTNSNGQGKTDLYLLKTDKNGNLEWSQTIGGSENEANASIIEAYEGGYLLLGSTNSFGSGGQDFYLVKTSVSGTVEWTRTYGGSGDEVAAEVVNSGDGGYVLAGAVNGGMGAGGSDAYLVKTNSAGELLWSKTYGRQQNENCNAIVKNDQGEFWIAGQENEFGPATGNAYLAAIDATGTLSWAKGFGTTGAEAGLEMALSSDGGCILAGTSARFGESSGNTIVLKIDFTGDTLWTRSFGGNGWDVPAGVLQTADGGYIVCGTTTGFGSAGKDVYLLKFDGNGNGGCNQYNTYLRERTLSFVDGTGGQADRGGEGLAMETTVSFAKNLGTIVCSNKPPENKPYKVRIGEINCQILQAGKTICFGEKLSLCVDTTVNYSLELDGDDYINCGKSNRFAFEGQDFSFSVWVKPYATEGRKTVLFKHSSASAKHGLYHLYLENGYPTFTVMNAARSKYIYTSSAAKLYPGTWYHLAVVASSDEKKIRLMVNGKEMAASSWKGDGTEDDRIDQVISTDEFLIGATFQVLSDGALGYGSHFNGLIDQVSFWNRALDDVELPIKGIEPLACFTEPGLIGYWNFNDGHGIKAMDVGINNNHARIFGARFSGDVPFDQHKPYYTYTWSTGEETAAIDVIPTQNTTYRVTATDGTRSAVDSVVIQVSRINTGEIAGVDKVSPQMAATYSVPSHPQSRYRWLIDGGEILAGGNSNTVTVEWQQPNDFSVAVVEINSQGCHGDTIHLGELPIYDGYILRNIQFERNSATLKRESHGELNKLAKLLVRNRNKRIELQGHTDYVGADEQYLKRLSERRAKAVADYLVDRGVSRSGLQYQGFGSSQPIATNDTEEGRQLNRRVEIRVVSK